MDDNHHRAKAGGLTGKTTAILTIAIVILVAFASLVQAAPERAGVTADQAQKTFFSQFIIAGGPIVWFILLPLSVATTYLAIDLCSTIRRKRLLPDHAVRDLTMSAARYGLANLAARVADKPDLVSKALVWSISKSKVGKPDLRQVEQLAAESLQEQSMHLMRKVEICNIIGNIAPMLGLLGTVFGMIKAFNILGISVGQPRPDHLAAAISIALVTTFWGLLIAIVALTLNGIFRNRIEVLVGQASLEVETLLRRLALTWYIQPQTVEKNVGQSRPKQHVQPSTIAKKLYRKKPQPIETVS